MLISIGHARPSVKPETSTHLPKHQPPVNGAENKHVVHKGDAANPLWKGHEGLLIAALAGIDMDVRLLVLGSKHVGVGDGESVCRRPALLEGRFDGVGWLK